MLKVLFFASLREQLDCAQLELDWSDTIQDLNSLQAFLGDSRGESWAAALGQHNLIRAVNQVVVEDNTALRDGDEVAFFPPVTGG